MKNYNITYKDQKSPNCNEPQYVGAREDLLPFHPFHKREVWPSKMFMIKLELDDFIKRNPDIPVYDASQGDGGMSLGGIPKEELCEALREYLPQTKTTKYGDPVGRVDVRTAIYENYYGFGEKSSLSPDNIVIGEGGRDLLQKWYQAILQQSGGSGYNLLVSAAPWGSYPEGAYINGLNVLSAPGDPSSAFKITKEGVNQAIDFSLGDNRKIIGLIITTPDNPTGNYMPKDEMVELIEHAILHGIPNIFIDLMYHAVTDPSIGRYDINGIYNNLSRKTQECTSFMDGLTKKAGASNLRNAHIVCPTSIAKKIKGIATHTNLPNALGEAAALYVYKAKNPADHPWVKRVVEPTAKSRKIVQEKFNELNYKFICDQGYYAFINIYPWLLKKIPRGEELIVDGRKVDTIENVEILKSYLTTRCGLAIIHGSVFKQPHFIRFSYANAPDYTEKSILRFHKSLTRLS